jgi:hypothetical protein
VAVEAVDGGYEDLVRFRFAGPTPRAPSTVAVHLASGPFTRAGSGAPIEVAGTTHMALRAEGLVLVDGGGRPTFTGERDLRPGLVTVRQVVAIDESEGVMTWIVGADYSCVSIRSTPAEGTITLAFTHAVP